MGLKVCEAVLNILNGEGMNSSFNFTLIALIPKKVSSDSVSDYCPISLCNIFYKLVSKTNTNRHKPIMHLILASNQSAFIPSRIITNHIIVAHELLHFFKEK